MKWKKYLKNVGISFLILVLGSLLLALFSYSNLLRGNGIVIFQFLLIFLSFFIGPYRQGKENVKYGFLEGLKVGGLIVVILFLLNYAFYQTFHLKNFFYYFLLLFISMVGGMIGIARRKEKK